MTADLSSKRVTVMGLGRFGGGAGIARWLVRQGVRVCITDLLSEQALAEPLAAIADIHHQVELHLGGHDERDFTNSDLVIANPAVPRPWENRYLLAAGAANVPITTEMRLLTQRLNRDRVIGVTGTAGKSTTAAMIHHALVRTGCTAHLGGNIGGSLLSTLDEIDEHDWIVLELSSFMLHWLGEGVGAADADGWSPHIAVVTNIEPNHLDWHGSMEHYTQSKENIVRYQTSGDHVVRGPGGEGAASIPLRIPGTHNQTNARMAVAAAAIATGQSTEALSPALSDFPGLPHRLCLVAEHDGLRFFDDSKSTTPGATCLAVKAFNDPKRLHLIAGGYDKGVDLGAIANLSEVVGGLYTIGATGRALASAAAGGFAEYCERLDAAVLRAVGRMRAGDVLLLSPGCASWDQFENFEKRGEAFAQCVKFALIHNE